MNFLLPTVLRFSPRAQGRRAKTDGKIRARNLALLWRFNMITQIPFRLNRPPQHAHAIWRRRTGRASRKTEADATLATLLDYGINHIDTAASYGEAELRIAPWMKKLTAPDFFLATKTEKRPYAESKIANRRFAAPPERRATSICCNCTAWAMSSEWESGLRRRWRI